MCWCRVTSACRCLAASALLMTWTWTWTLSQRLPRQSLPSRHSYTADAGRNSLSKRSSRQQPNLQHHCMGMSAKGLSVQVSRQSLHQTFLCYSLQLSGVLCTTAARGQWLHALKRDNSSLGCNVASACKVAVQLLKDLPCRGVQCCCAHFPLASLCMRGHIAGVKLLHALALGTRERERRVEFCGLLESACIAEWPSQAVCVHNFHFKDSCNLGLPALRLSKWAYVSAGFLW